MRKIELLAPAGDLEKLKFAIEYGADAVYLGGQIFGLRAASKNFTLDEMKEGVAYAHARGKKVYLTLNIIPHNGDLEALPAYLEILKAVPFDAVIVSDPGTILYLKEHLPEMELHLSTQANNTNHMSARFWHAQGVKRIVLARELSLGEIGETVGKTADLDVEYEVFVHGAMCISYSGRCLLSNYMVDRDANKGDCAQSCRWKYHLVEEKRPGEYYPVVEDEKGTYFFNSKDLCMVNHLAEVVRSGVTSLKIEGRNKSIYYVANVVRAYRQALDALLIDKNEAVDPSWLEEIRKASHRQFTTGFYFDKPNEADQLYETSSYVRDYDFLGYVMDYDPLTGLARVEQRNKFSTGEMIEIMGPGYRMTTQVVEQMFDANGVEIQAAPHARQTVLLKTDRQVEPYDILRRKKGMA